MYDLSLAQLKLQAAAQDLAQSVFAPTAAQTDLTEQYPWDNVAQLRDAGFMGMTLPKRVGGRGLSYLDTVIVIEEMAKACATMGRITVEANMGAIGAIAKYGTPEQLKLAADLVLAGDKPAICISAPQVNDGFPAGRPEARIRCTHDGLQRAACWCGRRGARHRTRRV